MILTFFSLISSLFHSSAIHQQNENWKLIDFDIATRNIPGESNNNRVHGEIFDEVFWISNQSLRIDLRGKDSNGKIKNDEVTVYATVKDDRRIVDLEQKVQEALMKINALHKPVKKRRWWCCSSRRKYNRPLYPSIELLPSRQPYPQNKIKVKVRIPPPQISNITVHTVTNPQCTNNVNLPSLGNTSAQCTTNITLPPLNSSPEKQSSTPAVQSTAPPPKEEAQTSPLESTTLPSPESHPNTPESLAPNTDTPEQSEKNGDSKPDAVESINSDASTTITADEPSDSNNSLADSANNNLPEGNGSVTSTEEPPTSKRKKSSMTFTADIQCGKSEDSSKEEPHPIYISAKKSSSQPGARKKILKLQYSMNENNENYLHPIYTKHAYKNAISKPAAKKEDDLVRKVYLSEVKAPETKPKATHESDNLVRKVYLADKKQFSPPSSETPSKDSPDRRHKRRLAVIGNYWLDSSEEDLYTKLGYRRPTHLDPQLESNYDTRSGKLSRSKTSRLKRKRKPKSSKH